MLEWLIKTNFLLPNFSWLGIALTVAVFITVVSCIVAHRRALRKKENENAEQVKTEEECDPSPAEPKSEEAEQKTNDNSEQKAGGDTEQKAGVDTEQNNDEQISADREVVSENKEGTGKSTKSKAVENTAAIKIAKERKMDKKTDKVYHISKRKEDNRWQVKASGATKALKLFFTQAEAIEYAKSVASNQDGRIIIHKEDGSFRKLSY